MMKKPLLLLLYLLTVASVAAYGQTVTGTVTSASDGAPVPGVSVILKGSATGTTSDADGRYSLVVTDPQNSVIVFSFIGFATQEVVVANRTSIDVSLSEDAQELSEVVVTALGIQRETKTLVYATQTVPTAQLTEVRDANNIANSFQGKIANVQINQGSGGPGSGARIVLRGNRSIQGSNNALIVVDGVPINNSSNMSTTGPINTGSNNDFGSVQSNDGLSSINPDDIESVNVLRGASAAALYGSQAGNGVIVITTKRGSKDKVTVNVNSGITAEKAFILPDVQNTYGQGLGGSINTAVGDSWGAQMTGQAFTNNLGQSDSYSSHSDNIKDFFRTGVSLNNAISVSGGGEKMQTYLSYTNKQVQGIVPKNDLQSHNVNLRISNQFSKKFSVDGKVTYLNQVIKNRPRTGEENAPAIDIYQMPRSMSLDVAKNYETVDDLGVPTPTAWPATITSIYQNPYWMINRTAINSVRNRVMGFLSAKYDITPKLSITGRANLDLTLDEDEAAYSQGTLLWVSQAGGWYQQTKTNIGQQWYDLILSGQANLGQDLKLDYRVGGIYQYTSSNIDQTTANGLTIPNMFSTQFGASTQGVSNAVRQEVQSAFGQASFAYKEYLFLELTARQDWNSALPSPYHYFYPSVGLSGIISDMVTLPQAISFLKLSANWARVGNGGIPQVRNATFGYTAGAGNGLLARSLTKAIADLKPEMVDSYELGLDAKFLDNRVGFNFSVYQSVSKNQLLQIATPVATGYVNQYINAGEIRNRGIELVVTGTPLKGKLTWDITYNLGINRNTILALYPGLEIAYLGGSSGYARTATPVLQVGGSYGDLVARQWQRDANGNFVVDAASGFPVATAKQEHLGQFTPKATMGLTNSFNYGRFSLRFLIDGRVGGILLDGTEMNLAFSGISKVTESYRDGGLDLGGVDKEGNPVDKSLTAQQFWTAGSESTTGKRYGIGEFFAYDATNFRLRELSVGYDIPVPQTFFIKSARISLVARNLFWIYRGSSLLDIPGLGKRKMQMDPDMSMGNGNWQGVQYGVLPSTRSIGCNINLTF